MTGSGKTDMLIRLMHAMRQISMHLVGIDVPTFDDVIVYGQTPDTDEFVQVYGWLKWMNSSVLPHTYLYLTRVHILFQKSSVDKGFSYDRDTMQTSMENSTLASCKVVARNDLYGSVRQTSLQLRNLPGTTTVTPRRETYNCSGCMPEAAQEWNSTG